jgi:hypothetical protein
MKVVTADKIADGRIYADYIDWRAKNPSDDLMTRCSTSSSKTKTVSPASCRAMRCCGIPSSSPGQATRPRDG